MNRSDNRLGITLMIAVSIVFAIQDGLSKYLAVEYNVYMVVMIRYWFFAAFVTALSASRPGGVRAVAATAQPALQLFRGALLAAEICVMVSAIALIGLAHSHALFACHPLLAAALSGPFLGERVGWRRWTAICAGFIGVLIILDPSSGLFSGVSSLGFLAALMFAIYGLTTRYAARLDDAATSFFWSGIAGALVATAVGLWFWEPLTPADWLIMGLLCLTGAGGHFLLIKCYEVSQVSVVQPFAYLHLLFATLIGVTVFGELLSVNILIGCALIVIAGLFTLARQSNKESTQ